MCGKVSTLISLQDGNLLQCKKSDCWPASGEVFTLISLQDICFCLGKIFSRYQTFYIIFFYFETVFNLNSFSTWKIFLSTSDSLLLFVQISKQKKCSKFDAENIRDKKNFSVKIPIHKKFDIWRKTFRSKTIFKLEKQYVTCAILRGSFVWWNSKIFWNFIQRTTAF